MINAVIFTCEKHHVASMIAAKAASSLFNVVFAVDENDRFNGNGFPVVKTSFERKGNLNGVECALGICEVLMAYANDGLVVKMDSDMVVKTNEITIDCDVGGYIHPFCPSSMVGCFYAASKKSLEHAYACIKDCEGMGVRNFSEDVLITGYASQTKGANVKRLSNKLISVWHPTIAPNPKKLLANFGNYRVNGDWHHKDALASMAAYAAKSIDTIQV
jgi:hypothetical protein